MSDIFNRMDELAAKRRMASMAGGSSPPAVHPGTESVLDCGIAVGCGNGDGCHCDEQEVLERGAVRDILRSRYDLMSPVMVGVLPQNMHSLAGNLLAWRKMSYEITATQMLYASLGEATECNGFQLAHLYAQASHEVAEKGEEQNWEEGISESNLVNRALFHMFSFAEGDTSENHLHLLVWNVMTFIHFREQIRLHEQIRLQSELVPDEERQEEG